LPDWQARCAELEDDPSPFTLVMMAHLVTQESRDGLTRNDLKKRPVRLVYQCGYSGYSRGQGLELFRIPGWMLSQPEDPDYSAPPDPQFGLLNQSVRPRVWAADRAGILALVARMLEAASVEDLLAERET
jgi:hypothetical protein